MKKCMLALFVSMMTLCGISVAIEIPVTELAGQTSCNSNETENIKLYLTSNGAIRNPGDVFRNNVDSLIGGGNNGSSVNIWRHGVISSCNTWNRISNIVDKDDSNGALVFLNTDNCVFNIPNYTKISNPTAIDAQIHFTVGYRLIYSGGPNSMTDKFYYRDYGTNQWTCYPNGNQTSDYNNCSNTTVQYGSKKSHTGECINYRVFWCGDGLVNSPYGTLYDNGTYTEECDPQAPGWNEETCNPSTCKVNPQCNSLYNGSGYYTLFYTGSWLNSSMSILCTSGAVTNFQPNPIPTNPTSPIQYTWSCTSGGVTTTGCNAVQMWCGDGVIQTQYGEQCEPGLPIPSSEKGSALNYLRDLLNQQSSSGGKGTSPSLMGTNTTSGTRTNSGYSCNSLCQLVQNPQCSSTYSGISYTFSYPGQLTSQTPGLCSGGTVTNFQTIPNPIPANPTSPIQYSWSCTTGGITITGCNTIQNWCGDGQVNGSEQCDPNDPNHIGRGDGCNASCQPTYNPPLCNSQYNGSGYYSGSYTGPWLNSSMTTLCANGTVTNFQTIPNPIPANPTSPIQYSWSCTTTGGAVTGCNAVQQWCGDGQLQTNYGEQCDPNDPSHQGWGGGGCSNSCQPVTVNPQCNSQYNGQVIYTGDSTPYLNQWMTTLCTNGSVTDFQYSGTPIQYTWSCTTGGVTITGCNAVQQWCGDGQLQTNYGEQCDPNDPSHQGWGDGCSTTCQPTTTPPPPTGHLEIDKTLVGSGLISNTGDTVVWKIIVTAVSGDVTNFTIKDTLPSILGYTDFYVLHNPGLSISSNPTTTQTVNGWEIKWDVIGTLTEGNYIEIQVNTYATQMPNPQLTYKNVGCVIYDNNETCDPEPIPGHLEILKELVGSGLISNTGDIVTWRIRVTAIGESFSGFDIIDRLPNILSYDSYTVIHNGGLTISNPVISGNEVIWMPSGVLSTGDYVEIELQTRANGMPEGGYVNVACISGDWIGEICNSVHIGNIKIEKTLVGNRIITNTGDTITWNIVVTAVSGDVENPIITDLLPPILSYSGYSVIISGGLNVSSPIISGNEIIWNTQGVLTEGNQIVIRVITSVEEMPDHDYDNVACVKYDENGEPVICDDENVPAPKLRIKKTFIDGTTGKVINVGDEIVYKITFGNSGDAAATITSIKDFLPNTVEYSASAIFISGAYTQEYMTGWSGIVHSGQSVQNIYLDVFTGITLNPGDSGYIILTGRVLSGTNQDNRTNFACIYLNDNNIECDDVVHEYTSLMCSSNISSNSNNICDGSSWAIPVDCSSSGGVAETIEILCDDVIQVSGTNISTLTGNCVFPSSVATHTVKCKVNGTTLAVSGSSCEGNYTITNSCGGGSSCFIAGTKVLMADGTSKNIEDVKIGEYVMGESGPNEVKGYDRPILGDRNLWKINDKGDYFVSDEHPFKTTEGWKSFNPELSRQEIQKAVEDGILEEELLIFGELEEGDELITRNGTETIKSLKKLENTEKRNANTQLYNFMLDGDNTYYANGYLVHNKGGGGGGGGGGGKDPKCEKIETIYEAGTGHIKCSAQNNKAYFKLDCDGIIYTGKDSLGRDYEFKQCKNPSSATCYVSRDNNSWTTNSGCRIEAPQRCFNVNAGDVSIEKGEVLAFYWNIKRLSDIAEEGDYVEYDEKNYPYGRIANYKEMIGKSCEDGGDVALNSMMCYFEIENGSGIVIPERSYPCLQKKTSKIEPKILSGWMDRSIKTYASTPGSFRSFDSNNDRTYAFRSNINYIQNFGSDLDVFGEYKIRLNNVKYLYCEDGKRVERISDAPCESNFVLTNSYTVQKTPSGNLRASTTELDKYKYKNGTDVFSVSKLLNAIATTEYEPNNTVNNAMMNFINKYEKLAVTVKNGNGKTIKKVPGKNIYFVEGNLNLGGSNADVKFDKPVTFVQTKGNTTIVGSFTDLNMMLLTNGKIIFEDTENCNPTSTQYRQIVKGIFYAKSGIERAGVLKNNEINKYRRCTQGGLTVKGVLIGKGLQQMMNNGRSNLNAWFGTTDSQKKNIVMDGASVLIEYSPSIFTTATMPPGAEDFTTALSIYKQ